MHAHRCMLALLAGFLATASGCRQASTRSQLVLELDPRRSTTARASTNELLRRALPVIRARVEALCFADGEAALRDERIIVEVARASTKHLDRLAHELTRPTRLTFKLLSPMAGEPERLAPLDPLRVTALGLVRPDAPERARVQVRFAAAAREQLAWVTATNLSNRLILTLDGRLAAAARITAPLRDGVWRAQPAAPRVALSPSAELPALSYRELLALDSQLRAALTVPLRRGRAR